MSRIKGTKSSAALIVAVVALVAALGGGAIAGVAVTSLSKKDKRQVKSIAKKLDNKALGRASRTAYVHDTGSGTDATLEYGKGATAVSDPPGPSSLYSPYVVTFDRSPKGCVAHASAGAGEPDGGANPVSAEAVAFTDVVGSGVRVWGRSLSAGDVSDMSFVLSVFC